MPLPRLTLRRLAIAALSVGVLAAAPVSGSAAPVEGDSLQELQQSRAQVRTQRAEKAGQVDVLQASDAEVTAALEALTAQVQAQQDLVEEAERALADARADLAAAEEAQAAAQAELDALADELKRSAVEAYVNIGSTDRISATASGDANEAVNKRVLLDVRANESQDVIERYRSVQEDLELQREAAADATARAEAESTKVTERKAELDAAHAEKQEFAEAVDARLNAALAEAASLAALDQDLSNQISAKQAAIARALAAQRAAEEARAAQRAAANKAALAAGSSGSGSSGSSGSSSSGSSGSGSSGGGGRPPAITGSGSIVSVGGIRVHQSIAGNLQSLLSAASAAGISFGGGGYRDPSGQIAVRKNNCGTSYYAIYEMPASSCSPPTAKPGSSMHERGLAIDFTQGGRTLTRSSSGFRWLQANAGRFGFRNLPSEPWHWSTNGN